MLAGSAYHGVAVNNCTADATRVADRVLAYLGTLGVLLVAMFAASALAACAGGSKSSPNDKADDGGDLVSATVIDAGPTTPEGAAPPYQLAPMGPDGVVASSGTVFATVSWLDAPASAGAAGALNTCGKRGRPGVSVHTLGGVRNAVVSITGVEAGRAPDADGVAEISISDCHVGPAAVRAARLGATLAVINDDERRHDVVVEHLGDGTSEPTLVARFSMPLVGHRVEVPLTGAGIVRATSSTDPADASYIVVPATPYVAVTGEAGTATFEQVPPGTYRLSVWHAPIAPGTGPLVRTAEITVVANETTEVTVPLKD